MFKTTLTSDDVFEDKKAKSGLSGSAMFYLNDSLRFGGAASYLMKLGYGFQLGMYKMIKMYPPMELGI